MRLKNKKWARPFIETHPDIILNSETFLTSFSSCKQQVFLEIGSGKGQFLLKMAELLPDARFYGIERALPAIAVAGRKLAEAPRGNVAFVNADVDAILPSLPEGSIAGIFLNFSDPWPKKRHEKRRLTHERYLRAFMQILSSGGRIAIKTDNPDLFAFSLKNCEKLKYNIISSTDDYDMGDPLDALTEYEESFRAQGIKIHRLVIRKD